MKFVTFVHMFKVRCVTDTGMRITRASLNDARLTWGEPDKDARASDVTT